MAGLADFVTGFQRGRQMKYYREDREEARRAREEGRQASTLAADILFPGAGGSAAPQQTRVPLSALATPSPLPMGQNRNMIDAPTSSQFGPVQFGIGPQAPISRLSGSAGQPVPAQGGVAPAGQPAPAGGAAVPGAGGVDPRLPQLARMGPQGLQTALAIQERQKAATLEQETKQRDRWGRYLGALDVIDDPAQQQQLWEKLVGEIEASGQKVPDNLRQFSPQAYQVGIRLWSDYDKSLERKVKESTLKKNETTKPEDLVLVEKDGKQRTLREGSPALDKLINEGWNVVRTPASSVTINDKSLTEAQAKAAGFADRMISSNRILGAPEITEAATNAYQQGITSIGGDSMVANWLKTSDRQRYEQAQRDFVNAVLRRESGAVIADSEFANAAQQYFPQPGDTPQVIAQKAENRKLAIQGIIRAAGPAAEGLTVTTDEPSGQKVIDAADYFK